MDEKDFKVIQMKIEDMLEAASVLQGLKLYQGLCGEHRQELLKGMPKGVVEFVDAAVNAFSGMNDEELFTFFAEQIAERRQQEAEDNSELKEELAKAKANLEQKLKEFLGARQAMSDNAPKTMEEFLDKFPHLRSTKQ